MDDTEDDARYPQNPYGVTRQQGYLSSNRQKLPLTTPPDVYDDDDDIDGDDEDVDDVEDEDAQDDEHLRTEENENDRKYNLRTHVNQDLDDDSDSDNDGKQIDNRMLKKRKLKSLISSYEFAPRVPNTTKQLSTMGPSSVHKPLTVGRNALTDWTEHETFVLLDAWGDQFLQHGRKSLRSEEWQEVSEKVSEDSKVERTDSQCRNRLDTLKKKYKKEKLKLEEMGNRGSGTSNWVYFKKMDMLMSLPQQQGGGGSDGCGALSCGLDSGEYVFLSPRAYLNRANGLDEMRDSPGNSESEGEEEGEEEEKEERGLDKLAPSRKRRFGQNVNREEEGSCLLLAKSIHKLSEIYERMEDRKRKQMVEIEKMRMDFHKDLEMQKRQIMERAQAEIAKLYRDGGEENGLAPKQPSE